MTQGNGDNYGLPIKAIAFQSNDSMEYPRPLLNLKGICQKTADLEWRTASPKQLIDNLEKSPQ
jgi:hypothetical protein